MDKMYKLPPANSRDKLWVNILQVMPAMCDPEMMKEINKLYDSLPRRMEAVIADDDGNIKY